MDNKTLEKIGGKVKWIEVPYTTTKLSVETGKNKWQTAGGDTIIARVDVGAEADPEAVLRATREWLKEKAVEANKETLDKLLALYNKYHRQHGTLTSQPTQVVNIDPDTGYVQRTPVPAAAKSTPVAQDAQHPTPIPEGAVAGKVGDEDVFDVDAIVIGFMPDGVTKTAKAKGGKWTKYGVKVWDEVLALPPLEWDLPQTDVGEYGIPKGLQAIVMMVDGKPKKVREWK